MANEENIIPHRYTSDQDREQAAKNGHKGGIASGLARRRKCASRKYLKEILVCRPQKTADIKRALEKIGIDPEVDIDVETLMMIAMARKALSGDLRAIELIHEYLGEDPHTLLEEKRLKIQQEAVNAIKNSDGFMEAMGGIAGEVFEDGGDTPDTLEDTD